MLEHLKREANLTHTENGALTNLSTGSDLLDLFATIGALRDAPEQEIEDRFLRAYTEAPELAMKLLFYARDIRGGLGERRVFRVILDWLARNHPESVLNNLELIPEFGRWDDLLPLLDGPCRNGTLLTVVRQLKADAAALRSGEAVSLLGKWLPSVNASNPETVRRGRDLARAMGLSERNYRKLLSRLRARIRILENNLRERDYSFDYEKQPSKAMLKYRKAFWRNDKERYEAFLAQVESGEAKLHTGTLLPYELVEPFLNMTNYWSHHNYCAPLSPEETRTLNVTWEQLEDFAGDENALAVVDTSGSMYSSSRPMPAAVAISLGLYFAERAKGPYRNHYITFSANPQLIELRGDSFAKRLRYICSFSEVANTNLQGVFNLILRTAVKNNLPQSELPEKLYIISDMEFDTCVKNASLTNFQAAEQAYEEAGYRLPKLVFWNVNSRNRQQPVTVNDRGVALVSGCSPRIFSMVMEGNLDPVSFMLSVLNSERYAAVRA